MDYLEGYHTQVNICLQNEVGVVLSSPRLSAAVIVLRTSGFLSPELPVQDSGATDPDLEKPLLCP